MKIRLVSGLAMVVVTIAQVALAILIVNNAQSATSLSASSWKKGDNLCLQALARSGEMSQSSNRVEVRRTLAMDEDWRVALMDVSGAIAYCQTRTMVSFCMGRACSSGIDPQVLRESIENQDVARSTAEALASEPIRISFSMVEVGK